jgi:predicted metal-dependent peptidase
MTATVNMVDIVSQFRMMVYDHAPYLAPYVYSLTPVERRGLGTMAVDKSGKLYYDPEFCNSITLEQGGYVVLHEGWHIVLRHCHRAEGIIGPNPTAKMRRNLNIAMDIVVWELMEAIKHLAPPGGVTYPDAKREWPKISSNMTVGELYTIINEEEPADEPKEDGKDEPGEESGDDQGEKEDGSPDQDEPDGGDTTKGDSKDGNGKGDKPVDSDGGKGSKGDQFELIGGGSAADGQPRDYEEEPDPNWDAFVEDGLLEQVERKIEELEEDRAWIRQHGNVPAELKRVIKSKLRPQPNPWDRLRATVAKAAANHRGAPDKSYKRPSRRQQGLDVRLKGELKYNPKAVVVIDTSGSMTSACLAKALVVIKQGLRAMGTIPVITCDAKVQQDKVLTGVHDDFELIGGGGTDMRIPLAYSEKKYKPDVTVLVTDTATPWPDKKLKGQLIVAATQDGSVPDWAVKVRIPNDPRKESLDD